MTIIKKLIVRGPWGQEKPCRKQVEWLSVRCRVPCCQAKQDMIPQMMGPSKLQRELDVQKTVPSKSQRELNTMQAIPVWLKAQGPTETAARRSISNIHPVGRAGNNTRPAEKSREAVLCVPRAN